LILAWSGRSVRASGRTGWTVGGSSLARPVALRLNARRGVVQSSPHPSFGIRKFIHRFLGKFILILNHFCQGAKTFILILVLGLCRSNLLYLIFVAGLFLSGWQWTSHSHILHDESSLITIGVGEKSCLATSLEEVFLLNQELNVSFLFFKVLLLFDLCISSIKDTLLMVD
jgi:hypothetical protein